MEKNEDTWKEGGAAHRAGLYFKDFLHTWKERGEAAFEAYMEPSRQLHKEGRLAKDAVKKAVLIGKLGGSLSGRARGSLSGSARGALPVKGDIIEALWTEDGKDEWRVAHCGSCSTDQRAAATGQAREARAVCEVPSNPVLRQFARMGSSLLARSPHQANRPSRRIPVRKGQG